MHSWRLSTSPMQNICSLGAKVPEFAALCNIVLHRTREIHTEERMRLMKQDQDVLIPGLRDSVALQCLARVPRVSYSALRRVSKLWRSALLSREFYDLRKKLGLQEPWIYIPFCSSPWSRLQLPEAASNWIQAYDPNQNLWHNITTIPGVKQPEVLKGFGFVAIQERLYIIGGNICRRVDSTTTIVSISKEVRVFNCITGKWSQCASMSIPRVDFACTICNGFIFVAGGRTDASHEKGVSAAEVYVPEQNAWIPLPNMTINRYKCVGVSLDSKVYVIGGFACQEQDQDMLTINCPSTLDRSSVEVFNTSTGSWELVRTMWQPDVPPNQIVSVQGNFYSSGDVLSAWKGRLELYDQRLNIWKIVDGSQRMQPVIESENSRLWDGHRRWQQCYLTMALVGESSLFFVGGYKVATEEESGGEFGECSSSSSSGSRKLSINNHDRDSNSDSDSNLLLEVVSVFETSEGKWRSFVMEQFSVTCKELCTHCCTVTL